MLIFKPVILKLDRYQNPLKGIVETQIAGTHPDSSWLSSMRLGAGICISNKFPGDKHAAGPVFLGPHFLCKPTYSEQSLALNSGLIWFHIILT